MELVKKKVNISDIALNTVTRMYVSEEQIVNEIYEPVGRIVKEKAFVTLDGTKVGENSVAISGTLEYSILYQSMNQNKMSGMSGRIPINEQIRIPDITEENNVDVILMADKVTVSRISERKLLVKADISAIISVQSKKETEIAHSAQEDGELCTLTSNIEPLEIVVDRKETFRVRDELAIPQNQGSIYKIVWSDIRLKNVSTKLMDRMMHIGGELYVFIYYITEDTDAPIQWHATEVSFGGNIDISEVTEDMISYVNVAVRDAGATAVENDMGESREIRLDVLLGLDIKIYRENGLEVIKDIYSPYCEVIPKKEKCNYNKLLIKNSSRNKYTVKVSDNSSVGDILQICNSYGNFRVDDVEVTEKGLSVTGVITAGAFYISSDDSYPVGVLEKEKRITNIIDVPEMKKNDEYYLNVRVEQVSANNVSSEEIEIKVAVVMELIVFEKCEMEIVSDVEIQPLDEEKIREIPALKGHIVQKGDTLWGLAKKNNTTPQRIVELNNVKNGQIKPGEKLLIAKSVR
ncbi:MAG: DUF3794 domain-containing protein [Lachnospiraceae bacterium]|nr:DUF3794 domain-containing protein [Lachnospiraceae bacterium]